MKKKEHRRMLDEIDKILAKGDDEISIKEKMEAIALKLKLESIPSYTLED